ncbi:hypothetical protein [Hymenobacter terricola]|uniref:hypothetical protein n=1 Tax=Hymenobacter terricola TaxID=2819236 RepID=UPI001B310513|nr:hypothetical protein [Hymenobacter terricola]
MYNHINFSAESPDYKVYALDETVYLKQKAQCHTLTDFEETDIYVGHHYGNPTSALIMKAEKYVIVAGHGLTIFDIRTGTEITPLNLENISWTNALHQDELDDVNLEFRSIAYSKEDKLRVFKMNILTSELTLLD